MVKLSFSTALFVIASAQLLFDPSAAQATTEEVSLECLFSNVLYLHLGVKFTCSVRSNVRIVREDTTVVNVDGTCGPGLSNANVTVFYALLRTVRYVPQGLDVLLPGLIGLRFEGTQLRHVTKTSLRSYANLRMFASISNEVQFLERDLFLYNERLEFVSFRNNRITFIDANVFDALVQSQTLQQLWLDGTVTRCGLSGVTTIAGVNRTVARLKTSECVREENAPALYLFWLSQQTATGTCDAQLAEKDVEIARLTADLATTQENLQVADGEVQRLTDEVAAKDQECATQIDEINEQNRNMTRCLVEPTAADCPTADSIRRTFKLR